MPAITLNFVGLQQHTEPRTVPFRPIYPITVDLKLNLRVQRNEYVNVVLY